MEANGTATAEVRVGRSDNLVQVSNKVDIKKYLNIARRILEKHEDLEITAIGESISNAIIVGETLCRNKHTVWKKLSTETIDSKPIEPKEPGSRNPRTHKKIKVSIKLLKFSQSVKD